MFAETTRIHELRFLFESVSGSYATFDKKKLSLYDQFYLFFLYWEELNDLLCRLI